MSDLIVSIVTALVKVVNTTREALAADLRAIAEDIEGGGLIPDEAFERVKNLRDDTKDAYDSLPD